MTSEASTNPVKHDHLLARFAWFVVGYFILVVLWGAVVRATGSGGGCGASWPLCNGYLNPLHHPRVATIVEFAHRQSTTVATCLMLALAVSTFRTTPPGHRARRAALWTLLFLVIEALLGAALVLRGWVENNDSIGRVIAQAVHFTNTLVLMAALSLTAWFLGQRPTESGSRASASKLTAWGALIATIIVGATGALAALADTLFPSPTLTAALAQDFAAHAPVLIRMRWLHPAAAVVALICIVALLRAGRRSPIARVLLALLGLQFVLGVADVLLLAPAWMQILHLLGADLYWIALVLLAAESIWPAVPTSEIAVTYQPEAASVL